MKFPFDANVLIFFFSFFPGQKFALYTHFDCDTDSYLGFFTCPIYVFMSVCSFFLSSFTFLVSFTANEKQQPKCISHLICYVIAVVIVNRKYKEDPYKTKFMCGMRSMHLSTIKPQPLAYVACARTSGICENRKQTHIIYSYLPHWCNHHLLMCAVVVVFLSSFSYVLHWHCFWYSVCNGISHT